MTGLTTGSHRANVADAKRGSIPAPSPFRAATARAAPCCEPRVVGSCLSLASGVLGKRMHLHDATLSVQHTERQRAAHHGRTEHDVWRQSCRSGYPPEAPEQRTRLHCEHVFVSSEVGPAVLECLAAEERTSSQIGCSSRAQGHLSRCDEHEVLAAADVAGLALSRAVAHWYRL